MPDEAAVDPGLARRIDLFAITKPRANQRTIWISGVLVLWSLVGCVSAAVARHWIIAAILFVTVLLTGLMFWVSLRAKRRVLTSSAEVPIQLAVVRQDAGMVSHAESLIHALRTVGDLDWFRPC